MSGPQMQDFHRVEVRTDRVTGLKAVFALHDLTLGPAAGGVRRWRYDSEDDAVVDAMRLAEGMTCKNALAGLPFGGGKSVILSDGKPVTRAQLRVFGRWLDQLGGEYVAAEDVGMTVEHMKDVRRETAFVTGIGAHPGPKTAHGVFVGIEAALEGKVTGTRIAVQGLGAVGMALVELLHVAGARLVVADLDEAKVQRAVALGAERAGTEEVLLSEVDVLVPCALGAVITPERARHLRAKVVAGSANNQLSEPLAGHILHQRGIRYAPDYVINAGGIIHAGYEYLGWPGARAQIDAIGPRLTAIFAESNATREPAHMIADRMAHAAVAAGRSHSATQTAAVA